MANSNIPAIDYTSRDEDSIKDEMVRRKPFLTPEWTDDNENDLGMALMNEIVAALSVLHYYTDRAAGEGFSETIIKRESLQKLFFFWNIPGAVPATVDLLMSIPQSLKQDVPIPALTQCQTKSETSPVFFETDILLTLKYELLTADTTGTDTINCDSSGYVVGQLVEINDDIGTAIQRTIIDIPSGTSIKLDSTVPSGYTVANNAYVSALNGTVAATEGKTVQETLNNSDGTAFQKRRSISKRFIDDSLVLVVNEGGGDTDWDAKETFYESGPTDEDFIWTRKWDDTVAILLGDGAQGKIPNAGATMVLKGREGGGSYGRVGHDTITQINDTIFVSGTPVSITVTNPEAASGGDDRMDLLTAKVRGPEILKTNDRYISRQDYISGARSVTGVGNANAVRVTQPGAAYNVAVYIVPAGGGAPSSTLKAAVKAELLAKGSIRVVPEVFDPGFARIQLGGTVYVLANYIQSVVIAAVNAALAEFFAVNNLEFGKAIRESDISRVIDETEGVDYVDITKLTLWPKSADISLDRWTGNATFGDVTVGSNVVAETWRITFLTATTFNVRGSVSGLQTATGVLGSTYLSDTGQVSFTITAGGTPMVIGDNASFRTADYRGNVLVLDNEIATFEKNDLNYSGGG
jgi:hypothetical protein